MRLTLPWAAGALSSSTLATNHPFVHTIFLIIWKQASECRCRKPQPWTRRPEATRPTNLRNIRLRDAEDSARSRRFSGDNFHIHPHLSSAMRRSRLLMLLPRPVGVMRAPPGSTSKALDSCYRADNCAELVCLSNSHCIDSRPLRLGTIPTSCLTYASGLCKLSNNRGPSPS